MTENDIGTACIAAAMKVHTALGPGLLETAYETCLAYELTKSKLRLQRQLALPVIYDAERIDAGFRIDLLVEDKVVLELKAVETIHSLHVAQLLTYLKLGKFKLGYILNFNVDSMRDGIKRVVHGL
jgi:GxxExxY protein